MRVLVTGAAGCLGRYIANDFARRGFEVVCVYRNRRPAVPADSRIRLVQSDLSEGLGLPDRYDAVFHAAASSPGPDVSAADMARDNVESTRRLVAHSLSAGARHFVFCSSISIYGNITADEVNERTSVCDPDAYGLTKLLGEALVAETAPKLSSLSLRLPAVLGSGATRNVLAVTAAKLQADEPVAIFNPDSAFNNAVHCADIAAFVATALNNSWRSHEALVLGGVLGAQRGPEDDQLDGPGQLLELAGDGGAVPVARAPCNGSATCSGPS